MRADAIYVEVEKEFFAVPATFDQMDAHGFGGQVVLAGMTDEQTRHTKPSSRASTRSEDHYTGPEITGG
jgi:hypothetical protein